MTLIVVFVPHSMIVDESIMVIGLFRHYSSAIVDVLFLHSNLRTTSFGNQRKGSGILFSNGL